MILLADQFSFDPGKLYTLINNKLSDWIATAVSMLPNFIVALLIVLVFVFLAKGARHLLEKMMQRFTNNDSLLSLMGNILYLCTLALGTFIALSILNLDGAVTSLLAGAGVIGLALGFAFQDIASNFIAGTMMSIRKPFWEGDLIETNDFFGKVVKIHLRTTSLITLNGQFVMIPNAEVFKKPLINYSRQKERRIDLGVGVHYKTDLEHAKQLALEAVKSIKGIDPARVDAFYHEFGDSSINFKIRFWIPFTNVQRTYQDYRDQAIIGIKKAFDEHNITIPFPMRTLDFGEVDFPAVFKEAGLRKD